ncbi:hypothetical protein JTE90_015495 [Oedothorax gibbosus]|uniref:Uncharacterized protein n=1 Tax=Oedothorax gibbosus TaxID=931172 RepID=A0AAV6VSC5_9ARAC|nr:hypothetical protein JTE90_015495 [Oedothorax gibbosus]
MDGLHSRSRIPHQDDGVSDKPNIAVEGSITHLQHTTKTSLLPKKNPNQPISQTTTKNCPLSTFDNCIIMSSSTASRITLRRSLILSNVPKMMILLILTSQMSEGAWQDGIQPHIRISQLELLYIITLPPLFLLKRREKLSREPRKT